MSRGARSRFSTPAALLGTAVLAASLLVATAAFALAPAHGTQAAGGPGDLQALLANPKVRMSNALRNYLTLKANPAALQAVKQAQAQLAQAKVSPQGRFTAFHAPGGALANTADGNIFDQNTESVALNPGSPTYSVGGYEDFRGQWFGPSFGNNVYVADGGAGLHANWLREGFMPGMLDPACGDGTEIVPQGDPSVADNQAGYIFYSSLAGDSPFFGSGCGGFSWTGVLVSRSNGNIYNPAFNCNDAQTSNSCWTTTTLIHESESGGCGGICAFDDRPSLAVDGLPFHYGMVYVVWDHFDTGTFDETVELSACTNDLASCSSPITISGSDTSAFGSSVVTASDGTAWVAYTNFDNTVNPAVDRFRLVHVTGLLSPTVASTHTIANLADIQYGVFSTTQSHYFTNWMPTIAIDASGGPLNGAIYAVWSACQVTNYVFFGPEACAVASIRGLLINTSTFATAGLPVPSPSGFNQIQPQITVDQVGARAGYVYLTYYTSEYDNAHVGQQVDLSVSAGGTSAPALYHLTTQPIDPGLDLEGGFLNNNPGFRFSIGDYFGIAVHSQVTDVHFTADYILKAGPALNIGGVVVQTTPINQQDNFLCQLEPTAGVGTCQ